MAVLVKSEREADAIEQLRAAVSELAVSGAALDTGASSAAGAAMASGRERSRSAERPSSFVVWSAPASAPMPACPRWC